MRRLFIAALVIVFLGGTLVLAGMFGYARATAPGPLPAVKTVNVPRGTNAEIGDLLAQAGIVPDAISFRATAIATMGKGPLKAGEVTFPEHAT